ncbi:universal stress protein [Halolamina sp.]|jgi:nucleotide-binding universal stress UspA family protein|uniref:universal stress protein n=1 Tax=Halolamina sp. TaxID=1940283 RepID=UPI000223BA0C|nr:UspA domain-containing protein [halophilic archaeon DL31]
MNPLEVDLVLVPVDGSEESTRAVEYAATMADAYDAAVHVVYVLGEEVARAIETGAVENDAVADETEEYVQTAGEVVGDLDVDVTTSVAAGFSTDRLSQHPGSVVLDTAESVGADFLVVPREPQAGGSGEVLEKAAEYVLLYASQPVLSV